MGELERIKIVIQLIVGVAMFVVASALAYIAVTISGLRAQEDWYVLL